MCEPKRRLVRASRKNNVKTVRYILLNNIFWVELLSVVRVATDNNIVILW